MIPGRTRGHKWASKRRKREYRSPYKRIPLWSPRAPTKAKRAADDIVRGAHHTRRLAANFGGYKL
jgi:hypothetical protein